MDNFVRRQLDLAKQIRYVEICFQVIIIDNGVLPRLKVSALRGGMGDMLMELFCVRDKKCEVCDFEEVCVMQKIMYPQYDIIPSFIAGKSRIGYLIDCSDYREQATAGDLLEFSITLFGKTIAEVRQVIQAFDLLGRVGIGEQRIRYRLIRVRNSGGILWEDNNYYREALEILQVGAYVDSRIKNICENRLCFQTPTDIRFKGERIQHFEPEAVMPALARRIYMYSCFEGIECEEIKIPVNELPKLIGEYSFHGRVKRWSAHTGDAMVFDGIRGYMEMEKISDECREMILMGELFQVGKNTKFGLGKIRLTEAGRKERK